MAQFRPAGLSDEDSDSDDYGFYEKPAKFLPHNTRKNIEMLLQDAIINGDVDEVEKILKNDLNNSVNMHLDSGWTVLMHACFHVQEKIVDFLLDYGADPNLHSDSLTPIMATCSNSSANSDAIVSIVTKLIEKGCILNIGDKYGQTPLMRAISSGRVEVVQILLDNEVNIEMRDQQGWTAVFWAAHHNQRDILEILIARGARLTEVDKSNRTALNIAESHDFQDIIEIIEKHTKPVEPPETEETKTILTAESMTSWRDYYPGIAENKMDYSWEIPRLLYGMNCERLTTTIMNSRIDLRTFLLLDEVGMEKLGITMPYERQRLLNGLRNFHKRGWKLSAVSGLYAGKNANFSVLDCLSSLGTHLQQVYILEATLKYTLREYKNVQNQLKFEPPGSPLIVQLKKATQVLLSNVNSIRKEISSMKMALNKISKHNPKPAGYIKPKTTQEKLVGYLSEAVMFCSVACLLYNMKHFVAQLRT